MAFVIQLIEDCGIGGSRSEHAGRFVTRYDPDYMDGVGRVWSCIDPRTAKQFTDRMEAFEFWRQTSTVRPVREDGKPNRPLTAFTVSIYDWEKQ